MLISLSSQVFVHTYKYPALSLSPATHPLHRVNEGNTLVPGGPGHPETQS